MLHRCSRAKDIASAGPETKPSVVVERNRDSIGVLDGVEKAAAA